MTVDLKTRILEDMKDAMRKKETLRLSTIRMLLAAIKQEEIDKQIVITDQHIYAILNRMLKQHQDSIAQFKNANRQDLVTKETSEVEILQPYLPLPLTPDEIDQIINDAILEVNATSIKEMNKVMSIIKPKTTGRANMELISNKIKAILKPN